MKKSTFALMATMLAGSLWVCSTRAQEPDKKDQKPVVTPVPAGTNAAMRPMRDPVEALDQRLKLQLTDDQKQKIKPVLQEETQKLIELRGARDMKAEDRRTKYMELREATKAKMKTILTEEQWQKYIQPYQGRLTPGTNPTPVAPPATPAAPPPAQPSK